ncbi:MAG: CBS domain-containing protein [Candidatus Lokiarchaeota archaeon]|nr:CBS domain-containing protein [Candidatus Lokiarchaeota archaeon]
MSNAIYKGPRLTYLDIAEDEVFMAAPDTSIAEIARTMVAHWIDSIFIVDKDEHILGIVTDGVILNLVSKEKDPKNLVAKDIMATPVYCVKASEAVQPWEKLKETFSKKHNRVNRVAIIDDNNKLIGVLNTNFLKKIGHFSRSFEISLKKKET